MIKWFSCHHQLYFFSQKKIQIEMFFAIKTFSFDTVYFVNFSVIKGTKWETGQSLLGAENLSQARRMREFWIRRTLASRALFQRRSAVRRAETGKADRKSVGKPSCAFIPRAVRSHPKTPCREMTRLDASCRKTSLRAVEKMKGRQKAAGRPGRKLSLVQAMVTGSYR